MKSFKDFRQLDEMANTHAADINEILYGLYMAGGNWKKFEGASDAKKQLKQKKDSVGASEYVDQDGRARVMADDTFKWMKANGFKGSIKKVWWTARPGVLAKAVGQDVDSRKNPTDVLVQTTSGQFLGLSAKSTRGKAQIGFKNPGRGTIEKELNIDLVTTIKKATNAVIKKHDAPASAKARKAFIRADETIKSDTVATGIKLLATIRQLLLKKLKSMSQEDLRSYVIDSWMDAGAIYPPYIKVTGHGKAGKYTTSFSDPLNNPKIKAITKDPIKLVSVGNESIGIMAGKTKILKMRAKFESEKMASNIKFSGDPW